MVYNISGKLGLSNIIITIKREKKAPVIVLVALIFNLGLNLILIPVYRQVGAAIVTSLTELLIMCVQVLYIPRKMLPIRSLRVGAKAFLASFAMASVIFFLRTLNIFIILPVAMTVYLAVATLFRTIPRDDIQALYRAIRHRGQTVSRTSPHEVELETVSH